MYRLLFAGMTICIYDPIVYKISQYLMTNNVNLYVRAGSCGLAIDVGDLFIIRVLLNDLYANCVQICLICFRGIFCIFCGHCLSGEFYNYGIIIGRMSLNYYVIKSKFSRLTQRIACLDRISEKTSYPSVGQEFEFMQCQWAMFLDHKLLYIAPPA